MFMLPMMLGGAALGAIQGKQKANREADIERETRNARSAEQRYSPWTGRKELTPIQYAKGGEFSGMLGGGLQGGMSMGAQGQAIDSAMAKSGNFGDKADQFKAHYDANPSGPAPAGGVSLGGSNMSAALGAASQDSGFGAPPPAAAAPPSIYGSPWTVAARPSYLTGNRP